MNKVNIGNPLSFVFTLVFTLVPFYLKIYSFQYGGTYRACLVHKPEHLQNGIHHLLPELPPRLFGKAHARGLATQREGEGLLEREGGEVGVFLGGVDCLSLVLFEFVGRNTSIPLNMKVR
jgi:hypothetical protein